MGRTIYFLSKRAVACLRNVGISRFTALRAGMLSHPPHEQRHFPARAGAVLDAGRGRTRSCPGELSPGRALMVNSFDVDLPPDRKESIMPV